MFEIHVSAPQRIARHNVNFGSPADLSKLCKEGRLDAAIQAVEFMDQQRIPLSKDIIISLLQGCTANKDLAVSRRVHTIMASNGFASISYWGDHLIRLFALCEDLVEANQVFCKICKPSVYTWNAIISAHVKLGEGEKAVALYQKMQQEGMTPAKVTFLWLLKACGSIRSVEQGRQIHKQVLRTGLMSDVVVGSTLVDMYCKCGKVEEAHIIFDELLNRNAVTWGAMISGYVQNGHGLLALELFEKMLEQGVEPDVCTFSCILKACGIMEVIEQGRIVHNQIIRNELESDLVVGSTLVDMYVKCGSLTEARKVFDELPRRNMFSWGAMIAGYAQHDHGFVALELFKEMQQERIKPSKVTFSSTLKACGSVGAVEQGKILHEQVVKNGYEVDVVVGNTLVDMYVKCGRLQEAQKVFDKLPNRNVVSWGSIIFGYVQHGNGGPALQLFGKMQQQGMKPDRVIFLCILKACSNTRCIWEGMHVHAQIIQHRLNADRDIKNAIVDMYVKCGKLEEAQSVFDNSPNEDVVSWAVMIAGYVQYEDGFSALELFKKMQQAAIKPDKFIFSCSVKSCISIGAIEQGRLIHEQIIRNGFEMDVVVGSTLIDMYANCGSIGESCRVFDRLPNRNIMSWGAIISGYTQNGGCREAWQCLEDMRQQGLKPNDVIFTSVLAACSHAGLLEEGCWYFDCMQKDHSITPTLAHYSCMIDLLGRAGCIEEAKDLLLTIPTPPDAFIWMALLTGCRTYGNIVLGKQCFDALVQLNPKDASGYVLMSNIYGAAQMWNDVDKLQQLRNGASAQKKPGVTWIEVNHKLHEFVVGGTKFSENDEVNAKVKRLNKFVKKKGYMPKLDLVLEQMSDGVKGNVFDNALRKWLSAGKPRLDQAESCRVSELCTWHQGGKAKPVQQTHC